MPIAQKLYSSRINLTVIQSRSIFSMSSFIWSKTPENTSNLMSMYTIGGSKLKEIARRENLEIIPEDFISPEVLKVVASISSSLEALDIVNKRIEEAYEEDENELDFLGTSNKFYNSINTFNEVLKLTDTSNNYIEMLTNCMIELNKKLAYSDEKAAELIETTNEKLKDVDSNYITSKTKKLVIISGLFISGSIVILTLYKSATNENGTINNYYNTSSNNSSTGISSSSLSSNTDPIISSKTNFEFKSKNISLSYTKEKYSALEVIYKIVVKVSKSFFF